MMMSACASHTTQLVSSGEQTALPHLDAAVSEGAWPSSASTATDLEDVATLHNMQEVSSAKASVAINEMPPRAMTVGSTHPARFERLGASNPPLTGGIKHTALTYPVKDDFDPTLGLHSQVQLAQASPGVAAKKEAAAKGE
jgi:hypothetical protein